MSAFALLIPPANFSIDLRRRTERSSTAPGNRLQETGFRSRSLCVDHSAFGRAVDILLAIPAIVFDQCISDRTGISPIPASHPPNQSLSYLYIAPEFGFRSAFAIALRQIDNDGFTCSSHLIGKPILFNLRQLKTGLVYFQRYFIGSLKHFEVFKGLWHLFPVPCSLLPDTRSFGTMLSPGKSSARADSTSELLRFL